MTNVRSFLWMALLLVLLVYLYIMPKPIQNFVTRTTTTEEQLQPNNNERQVHFLRLSEMSSKTHQSNDYYSGMWWVHRHRFVKKFHRPPTPNLESASYAMFRGMGNKWEVRMTRDWLDFSVEHLSKYWKGLSHSSSFLETIAQKQTNYMNGINHTRFDRALTYAFETTVALVPVHFDKDSGIPQPGTEDYMPVISMASTIASLWRVGIRRIILAGNTLSQPAPVQKAMDLFAQHTCPTTGCGEIDLIYRSVFEKNIENINLPAFALEKLQMAMNGFLSPNETKQWLGDTPKEWKYVYFSEPDLILHTRQESLKALSDIVRRGQLMAAHRFDLIPHEFDFPNQTSGVLPAVGRFAAYTDLDAQNGDACCDAGNWWPVDNMEKVHWFWPHCGFRLEEESDTPKQRYDKHFLLHPYPSIRLKNGMMAPAVQEHGRVCIPMKGECKPQ